ncbi:MAG: hypothetical protein R6V03_02775, partial [Kiritimatiellia bacterium]
RRRRGLRGLSCIRIRETRDNAVAAVKLTSDFRTEFITQGEGVGCGTRAPHRRACVARGQGTHGAQMGRHPKQTKPRLCIPCRQVLW